MTWHDKPTTRPAYRSWPEGRGWRCSGPSSAARRLGSPACSFTEPEGDRPHDPLCPICRSQLVRTVADFNVVQEQA